MKRDIVFSRTHSRLPLLVALPSAARSCRPLRADRRRGQTSGDRGAYERRCGRKGRSAAPHDSRARESRRCLRPLRRQVPARQCRGFVRCRRRRRDPRPRSVHRPRSRAAIHAQLGARRSARRSMFNHMHLQPVIDVAPDGKTAFTSLAAARDVRHPSTNAQWGSGVYENVLVKEDGVWKFKYLHGYQTFYTNYEDGWAKRSSGSSRRTSGCRRTVRNRSRTRPYPPAFVPPFHYNNPVSGRADHYGDPNWRDHAARGQSVRGRRGAALGRTRVDCRKNKLLGDRYSVSSHPTPGLAAHLPASASHAAS